MFWSRNKKLAVAVTCSDWRLHQRVVDFNTKIGNAVGCARVDMVVLPGPDGLILPKRVGEWQAVQGQVDLLAKAHHAEALAVVAHQRCAGHDVSDAQHEIDVAEAAKALKAALSFAKHVYAIVAVYRSDSDWTLKAIARY